MIIKHLYPLISCICITKNRPAFLIRAVINFDLQNYPERELVISYPKDDLVSKNLIIDLKKFSKIKILAVEREPDISIGKARNQAIKKCTGEYICTWDDDDWHRDLRLMYQFTILRTVSQKREACILPKIVLYDNLNSLACYSDSYSWEGTILCKKELVIDCPYSDCNREEGAKLIEYLASNKYLHYFENYNLFAHIYHGTNIHSYDEYLRFFNNRPLLDPESKYYLVSQIKSHDDFVSNWLFPKYQPNE